MLDQPIPPLLCVMEESGPAVLDQPTLPSSVWRSGPAVLDQLTPPLSCNGEEWSSCARPTHPFPPLCDGGEWSSCARPTHPSPPLCDGGEWSSCARPTHPSPPLCDGGEWSSCARPTPLPSSVSCSCAAAQEETRRTPQGNQQLFTSCSGCGDCAISILLCAPQVVSHVTCTCSFVFLLLLLRCVHSVSACHDQSVLPYASW